MNIDTAGNPVKTISPWCEHCCAPTDTGGNCTKDCQATIHRAPTTPERDE